MVLSQLIDAKCFEMYTYYSVNVLSPWYLLTKAYLRCGLQKFEGVLLFI